MNARETARLFREINVMIAHYFKEGDASTQERELSLRNAQKACIRASTELHPERTVLTKPGPQVGHSIGTPAPWRR